MAESKRCPNCGGLNPVDAEWCGQCLQRFAAPAPPPPPPPPPGSPVGTAAPEEDTAVVPAEGVPAPDRIEQQRGAFTVTESGITWRCSRCDSDNPLDAPVCAVCGMRFADSIRPQEKRAKGDPRKAALRSLFFPGAGHWLLGLKGLALAHGIPGAMVIAGVVLGAMSASVVMTVVFAVCALALWSIAAHDAYREASGQRSAVILKGRAFIFVVAVLLLLMITMLIAAGARVNR